MCSLGTVGNWILSGSDWSECYLNANVLKSAKYFFVPYNVKNQGQHWCLAVADLSRKYIYHFDSLHRVNDTHNVTQNFVKFFNALNNLPGSDNHSYIDIFGWEDLKGTVH